MGEMDPPTAADYAYAAAEDARRGFESNVEKIKRLEADNRLYRKLLIDLNRRVKRLEAKD